MAAPKMREQGRVEPSGRLTANLQPGGKVVVIAGSRRLIVRGWDRATVEAVASSDASSDAVALRVGGEEPGSRISIGLSEPALARNVELSVNVPRSADVEVAGSYQRHATIDVSGVTGSVNVGAGSGDVTVSDVGPSHISRLSGEVMANLVNGRLVVRSTNGSVNAVRVGGVVEVAATNGDVVVREAQADVRVNSANGDIEVSCSKGRVDLRTASGDIMMIGIGGGVDVNTASGDVIFRGSMRPNGRYELRTISGDVQMSVQPEAPGFTATLTSYSGEMETDFPLKLDPTFQGHSTNRKLTGIYGDGQAQIRLDSFSGSVRILKWQADPTGHCK